MTTRPAAVARAAREAERILVEGQQHGRRGRRMPRRRPHAGLTATAGGPVTTLLALVLVAGIYLPAPLVRWFEHVAALLG